MHASGMRAISIMSSIGPWTTGRLVKSLIFLIYRWDF